MNIEQRDSGIFVAEYPDPTVGITESSRFTRRGYTVITVLECLKGQPLDDYAYGLIESLRPSAVRVSRGEIKTDAWTWRVTVMLKEEPPGTNIIDEVFQEVEIGLPDGVNNGHEFRIAMHKRGVEVHA